jgi:putative intracellular protease/amidase
MGKKVLLVTTSAPFMGDHPTGVWLEEAASPYYVFVDAGWEVSIASPAGGPIPIDAASISGDFFTPDSKKFLHDATAMGKFSHSLPMASVKPDDYDTIFMAGGHGTVSDFIDCPPLKAVIEKMYADGKKVASVCHGPLCLVNCKKPSGEPIMKDHKCTVFTNVEEGQVQLTDAMTKLAGFLCEDKFKELGGVYECADPWNSKAVEDGPLITGQNPQSSEAVAKLLVAACA